MGGRVAWQARVKEGGAHQKQYSKALERRRGALVYARDTSETFIIVVEIFF